MKHILLLLLLTIPALVFSQQKVSGSILELQNNKEVPLPFANVFWLNSQVGTVTDIDGNFSIEYSSEHTKLVISYVGYTTDTISVTNPNTFVKHVLKPKATLDEVILTSRIKATSKSYLKSEKTK